MDLIQKIKTFNYDYIIYTNLFGVINNTPYSMLQRKQTTHILCGRFAGRDGYLYVVSYSKYFHVNTICFICMYYSNMGNI